MPGTNLNASISDVTTVILTMPNGLAIVAVGDAGSLPAESGVYSHGCLLLTTGTSGNAYINTGSTDSPSWDLILLD